MMTYTTRQGDMWDTISKHVYGTEKQLHTLIKANPGHRHTIVFSAGVILTVPEIDTNQNQELLPPWK
ncbi:MAG: phage tail protein [Desulfobacteraceae bacterium]|nr:phage tail protein [Desulfobacteraceae bacterium]